MSASLERDDRGPETMLGGCLLFAVLGCLLAVLAALYYGVRDLRAVESRMRTIEAHHTTEIAAITASARLQNCKVPSRAGDRIVITVWRAGDSLVTRCVLLLDPADPARALLGSPLQ